MAPVMMLTAKPEYVVLVASAFLTPNALSTEILALPLSSAVVAKVNAIRG
jgi:hypothetical protein